MAKIVVTTSTNCVRADMNDYAAGMNLVAGVWRKKDVSMRLFSDRIEMRISGESAWKISNSEDLVNEISQVDSVNGGAPTDLSDLFDKLFAALD